jgi:hypothetical protein
LLKETVKSLLENLLVSWVGDGNSASQNLVAVAASIKANLVVFSGFPVVVEASEPSVNLKVVKGHVGNDLLLKGSGISVVINVVLKT